MAIRVLHTGDWHIGNFPGPEINGQNARYLDICRCLEALVREAQASRPDIIIVAGDVFHSERVWASRGLNEVDTAVEYIYALSGICPVVVIRGTMNHDGAAQFDTLKRTFSRGRNVHIVTEPGVLTFQTGSGEHINVACLPGFDRGYFRAKNPGMSKEEENEVFTKAVEDLIIGLRVQCDKGSRTVLVSHYTITGCNMESGQTAFFSKFEPVVYPSTLQAADFDLACFGHIHRPQKLEGCQNTFYCGAVSALNFNDENQKRGFWIHDIHDSGMVTSTFHCLPTREFLTIRLDDGDIEKITAGDIMCSGPLKKYDVKDKIVRVLYDCTDEHNKAFNHAVLEKFLLAAGAFWVQEITPQKITITVDRRSMEADDTPEDNLAAYLEEKETDPGKIGEIIELARPIISEAMEKAATERRTGLFVPMEISVKNYRNYQEETFSFSDISFCVINGENGVGKSSLFMDAMLDALFEEPREGDLTGWIRNAPEARSGAIKFTFAIGKSVYRVTRTRQKSGRATLNIAEFVDGEWTDRSKEKYRDTQAEIRNILGMDSLTLKACALIMQDQYGLFLQADREARMSILGSILGLGIYARMEEIAADKLTSANREIRLLAERIGTIMEGIPDMEAIEREISGRTAGMEELKTEQEKKEAETSGLRVKLNTQLEAAERAAKLSGRISTLTAAMAAKEAARTTQEAIAASAEETLAKEQEITAGVQHYNALIEREKEEIRAKAEYDALAEREKQILRTIESEATQAENAEAKGEALWTKIRAMELELERSDELEGRHKEYEGIREQLSGLEELEPGWRKKTEAVQKAEETLDGLKAARNEEYRKCRDRYGMLTQKVSLLADSGCPDAENARCRFLEDALKAKEELPEVEKQLKEYQEGTPESILNAQEALRTAEKELSGEIYTPELYEALRGDLKSLEAYEKDYIRLDAIRNEHRMTQERLKELQDQARERRDAAGDAREELKHVSEQLRKAKEANARYERLREEIEEARVWVEMEKQIPIARERKKNAAVRIKELAQEIEAARDEITESRAELEKEREASADAEGLKYSLQRAEKELAEIRDEIQSSSVIIGRLKEQQERAKDRMKQAAELQEQLNAVSAEEAGYEVLKRAFSQDGIPHNIIRSIIPVFEATATNILGQMSGGKMSVEFVTEKTLKSNSKKEVTALDIIINDCDTGRLPYMSRSGGERVKAALSVILALSEIKSRKEGIQLGFLFIDEAPFLDAQGVQAYCDALEAIQARYADLKIMAITHDPEMKSRFPQSIDVIKTQEGSKVIYD